MEDVNKVFSKVNEFAIINGIAILIYAEIAIKLQETVSIIIKNGSIERYSKSFIFLISFIITGINLAINKITPKYPIISPNEK